jgi:hypothetical protein
MARSGRWVFGLGLVLAACGGGSSPPAGTGTTVTTGPSVSSSSEATVTDTPQTLPGGNDGTPGGPPAGGGDNGGGTIASSGASTALDPHGPVGSFAPVFLAPARSSSITVEVRTQSGVGPAQASLDHLTSVLGSVSAKPVSVTNGAGIDGGAQAWSPDAIRAAADAGVPQGKGGAAVLRLLFVHGTFQNDNSVLGVAVDGDTAAIFSDQIAAASSPLVGSGGIEAAVVTHESGHLLGLVDLYLHTGRQDPDHPGHSTNPRSVMYWAVESNLVADVLQGGPPKDFDDADRADLATIAAGG